MCIVNRLKTIAEKEGITITSLEQKIGASKGVLSRALKNNTDIQSKWVSIVVENYPQYNSFWVLTGKGPILKENDAVKIDYSDCPLCKEKEKLILNQTERILELKETIAILQNRTTTREDEDTFGKRQSA